MIPQFSSIVDFQGYDTGRYDGLCWLLMTSVQKNRHMYQEHHEGATLTCWLHESSTEKRENLISSGPSCFAVSSARKARVMKRLSLRSGKRSSKERHRRLTCRRHLRNTGNGTEGLRIPQVRHTPTSGTLHFFVHSSSVKRFCGNRGAIHPGLVKRGSCLSGDPEEPAPQTGLGSVA